MIFIIVSIAAIAGLLFGFLLAKQTTSAKYQQKISDLEKTSAIAEATKLYLDDQLKEQRINSEELKKQMKLEFENIGSKILSDNSEKFRTDSENKIKTLLDPLKDNIESFRKKVEDTYNSESRERFALKSEINRIVEESKKMSIETDNLTKALRGDQKAQGTWGEITLERLLESSGLRKGEEYTIQGVGLGLKDGEGKIQKPDVIINLPENKHLIIDSKVSIKHYEMMTDEKNEVERDNLIKEFVNRLYSHVDDLSKKAYQSLDKLGTPDFVFLFMPLEGAFSLAVQKDKDLFQYAWKKNIVIVCPSTLLATLRTVASIWRIENQNKNAIKIADESGKLYDKFVGLYEDLESIGSILTKAQSTHEEAMNKLKTGRGNLISRVNNIRKLGAKTEKALPLSSISDDEIEDTQ
ncbi:MAG: DNA recombination protein RmuC [bacterium]